MEISPIKPNVGQIWIDNDPRMGHRQIQIKYISVTNSYALVENLKTGRWTQIRLDRFKPTANGYRLKGT